jgi:hypothetical protein
MVTALCSEKHSTHSDTIRYNCQPNVVNGVTTLTVTAVKSSEHEWRVIPVQKTDTLPDEAPLNVSVNLH